MSTQPLNQPTEELNQHSNESPGQRIRKLREEAGLKQKELAELLHFTSSYLGQVERGAKPLSKNLADVLCDYFHVDYNYLYHGIRLTPSPELGIIHEEPAYDHDFRARLKKYIRKCSEDECRMVEPILKSMLQSLRETGWFDSQEAGQIKDES